MNNKFNKGFTGVLVIVLIAIVVIGSGIYLTTTQTQTSGAKVSNTETNLDVASSWKTYKNNQRKFSFNYPSERNVSEIGGSISLTVSIDQPSTYSLYFIQQGRADDFSAYKIFSKKNIVIDGRDATERLVDTSGSGEITVSIEVKRYPGSDGMARSDSFGANFKNIDDANTALPEIESIAKTLKYF